MFNTTTAKNIVIYQGATFSYDFSTSTDLTGYSAEAKMKKEYDATEYTEFTTTIPSPVSSGIINIALTATQTATIDSGRYVYDIKLTDPDTNVIRAVHGIVTVYPEATQ